MMKDVKTINLSLNKKLKLLNTNTQVSGKEVFKEFPVHDPEEDPRLLVQDYLEVQAAHHFVEQAHPGEVVLNPQVPQLAPRSIELGCYR